MKIFKYLCLALLIVAMGVPSVLAESETFKYHTRNPRTREDINRYTLTVEMLTDSKWKYSRHIVGKKIDKYEDFLVDKMADTLEWSTKRQDEETNYTGKKNGRELVLKGTLKGASVDKTITLEDDKPFYFSPKFNLQKFIQSDEQEIQFWTLRKDELTPYLMIAKKNGTKTLRINGEELEAVKVKYSPAGKFAKYYRRTYFYRPSDGLFVQRKSPTGSITRFVGQ